MDSTTTLDAPPDWSSLPADPACPLCNYNLRGLTNPRCPECGFAFSWAELLDQRCDRHRFLFEHGRGHSVRSFLGTWVRTALPRRFWTAISLANPVHAGRLVIYWLLGCLPLLAVVAGPVLGDALRMNHDIQGFRSIYHPMPGRPGVYGAPGGRLLITAAERDRELPQPWTLGFARRVFIFHLWKRDAPWVAPALVVAAWPWLSAATLLLFQASLRRAKVRSVHVLRAAIYGCDFSLLMAAASLAVAPWGRYVPSPFGLPSGSVVDGDVAGAVIVVTGLCAAVATVRMSAAYRRYLRFDRPVWTVVSAQVIVALLVCALMVRMAWVLLRRAADPRQCRRDRQAGESSVRRSPRRLTSAHSLTTR